MLISTISIVSCSSNDEDGVLENKKELKVVIDGKEEVFNTVVVNKNAKDFFTNEDVVQLTATINSSTTKVVTIVFEKGAVGNNSYRRLIYEENGERYGFGSGVTASVVSSCNPNSNLTLIVSKNDDTTLSGNFSGKIDICDANYNLKSKTFSEGSFTFNY